MTHINGFDKRESAVHYTEAWNSHDPDRVASFFSTDGAQRDNDGPRIVGRSAISKAVQSFMATLPDLKLYLDDVQESNGKVLYQWSLVGTHSITGKKVRFSGHEEWTMGANGLIAESIGTFDENDFHRQAGV
jgi:uncharacterized protein (TIGR02246 family)